VFGGISFIFESENSSIPEAVERNENATEFNPPVG
jgi:hypothetical protein